MDAYGSISKQYFYKGDLMKAKYFDTLSLQGQVRSFKIIILLRLQALTAIKGEIAYKSASDQNGLLIKQSKLPMKAPQSQKYVRV